MHSGGGEGGITGFPTLCMSKKGHPALLRRILFEQKNKFWPKFRNSVSALLCQRETYNTTCYTCKLLKVNRQRPKFVMQRPELKIPTLAKWLISPLVRVIIKICKKHLVLKTNSNINIYNET